MKFASFILSVFCVSSILLTSIPSQAQAQDSVRHTTGKKKKKPLTKMQQAFKGVKWATDKKPNLRAKYYIYLMSASWCGPCRALMPKIVEAYKTEMGEGKQVEVILTACERTPDAVPAYLAKYGAPFPGIHIAASEVSGFIGLDKADMTKGIPFVTICDNEGKVLAKGTGAFYSWKETIQKDKEAKKAAKKEQSKR